MECSCWYTCRAYHALSQVPMGILESVDIDVLDMGDTPLRMGGIKARWPSLRAPHLILTVPSGSLSFQALAG